MDKQTILTLAALLLTNSAATLNIPNLSSVSVDDVSASSLMIEYLYAQGHRKIGLIGGKPDQSRPSLSRLTGSQSAMFRLGLPFGQGGLRCLIGTGCGTRRSWRGIRCLRTGQRQLTRPQGEGGEQQPLDDLFHRKLRNGGTRRVPSARLATKRSW